jgi:hypothetical protein
MDYKTTDYCDRCGESPDSGTHLLGPNRHDYVPPNYLRQPAPLEAALRAALEPQLIRVDAQGRVMVAPSLMRVMVEDRPGMPQFGVVLGMLLDERGDMQAVVRLDGYGMMLKAVHPSKVTPVTPEQEEAYKP